MLAAALMLLAAVPAMALDHVVFQRDGRQQFVSGRVLTKLQDGGLLLQSADGVIWSIEAGTIDKQTSDEQPFVPLTQAELAAKLLEELPKGFEIYTTKNYLIAYQTSKGYAQWCGALLERLNLAFTNYWKQKGFKLKPSEFPLVAVVFADRAAYADHARRDVGSDIGAIIGYYSFATNRVTMYDLTGRDARSSGGRRTTAAQVQEMLRQPGAERNVATVVHEATHQLAFNSGLQTRYADIPLWLSEGLAMYFETPDLESSGGWKSIGAVNQVRLDGFRRYAAQQRPGNSLKSLLDNDDRFRDPSQAAHAYDEAWALSYFLLKQHPREYLDYLRLMNEKRPLMADTPEQRLHDFQRVFGEDLGRLDQEFMRFLSQVR